MTTALRRTLRRILATLGLLLATAAVLAAQELECNAYRNGILSLSVGGYSGLAHLDPAATTDFRMGYSVDASLGWQLNDHFGVHGDFTFARAQARGSAPFAGSYFNRFFYGLHVELKQANENGAAPYVFGGAGAVTVEEAGAGASVATFTRPAGMLGAGVFFEVPRSTLQMFAEGKGLVYSWREPGYGQTQWDVTFALGLSYKFRI